MAVERFIEWLNETDAGQAMVAKAKAELKGFDLACWCPLTGPCHADVLIEVANQTEKP